MRTTMPSLTMLAGADDLTPPQWFRAACRGDAEPDRWFPHPSESLAYPAAVCARCPLERECGEHAAAAGESGVWGGHEYRSGRLVR